MHPSASTAGGRGVTRWSRETIIEKILEWNELYGEPPCSADWNPSLARWRAQDWRADRYREGIWPSTNAAKRPFDGSFDAAIRAAGLEPHKPGPRRARDVAEGASRPAGETGVPREPAPRGDRAPAAGGDARALAAALERARETEARVAALERGVLFAEGRADRAETKAGETRRRARRSGDKRARRERVRVVRRDAGSEVLERAQALVA